MCFALSLTLGISCFTAFSYAVTDPCDIRIPEPFPVYIGSRNEHCKKPTSGPIQCDKHLLPNWYVLPDAAEMLNVCPSSGTCGVDYPAWMNGSFPTVAENLANRTICISQAGNCCNKRAEIQVKNCSGFYVYYLGPLVGCDMVYCFESSLPCIQTTTTKVTTTTATTKRTDDLSTEDKTKAPSSKGDALLLYIGIGVGALVVISVVIIAILLKLHGHLHIRSRVEDLTKTKPPPYSESAKA